MLRRLAEFRPPRPRDIIVCGLGVFTCILACGGPPDAPDARTYQHRTLEEWRQAIKAEPLDTLGRPDVVAALTEIALDVSAPWADRRQAALTLGRIGAPAIEAVPKLAQLLDGDTTADNQATVHWALKALALFGAHARSSAPAVRMLAADAAQPLLTRMAAFETLAKVAPESPATVATLTAVLHEQQDDPTLERELRNAAVQSLELLRAEASPALPELLEMLESPWALLRRNAALTLAAIGPRAEIATPALVDVVLFDDAAETREAAAIALSAVGDRGVGALLQLLTDDDPEVQHDALVGIRRAPARALDPMQLALALATVAPAEQAELADLLLQHEPEHDAATQALGRLLTSDDPRARRRAAQALMLRNEARISLRPTLEDLQRQTSDAQARALARKLLQLD